MSTRKCAMNIQFGSLAHRSNADTVYVTGKSVRGRVVILIILPYTKSYFYFKYMHTLIRQYKILISEAYLCKRLYIFTRGSLLINHNQMMSIFFLQTISVSAVLSYI